MGFHGVSWGFVRFRGVLWGFMGFRGVSWGFVGFCEVLWGFVGFCEVLWGFVGFHGVSWGFVRSCGVLWGFMGFRGVLWGFMRFRGVSWGFVGFCGVLLGVYVVFALKCCFPTAIIRRMRSRCFPTISATATRAAPAVSPFRHLLTTHIWPVWTNEFRVSRALPSGRWDLYFSFFWQRSVLGITWKNWETGMERMSHLLPCFNSRNHFTCWGFFLLQSKPVLLGRRLQRIGTEHSGDQPKDHSPRVHELADVLRMKRKILFPSMVLVGVHGPRGCPWSSWVSMVLVGVHGLRGCPWSSWVSMVLVGVRLLRRCPSSSWVIFWKEMIHDTAHFPAWFRFSYEKALPFFFLKFFLQKNDQKMCHF